MKMVSQQFFNRPVVRVAKDLIGSYMVRRVNGQTKKYLITETEAYNGVNDLACHASKGRTKRTEIMFGPPGHCYVYFVYGMHWLLNIVTGPKDYPAAVLIRGVEGANGPAKMTRLLKINGSFNGKKLGKSLGLWIEQPDTKTLNKKIKRAPRIGVDYAGPIWSQKKWRFFTSA